MARVSVKKWPFFRIDATVLFVGTKLGMLLEGFIRSFSASFSTSVNSLYVYFPKR